MLQVINVMPSTVLSFALMFIGVISIVLSMFKRASYSNDAKSVISHCISFCAIAALCLSSYHIKMHVIHVLLVFLLVCILQIHLDFNSARVSNYSVYFLVISAIVATLFASEAKNFVTLYLSFEAISFVGYILVSLLTKKSLTSEGAVKYFVIGGVSSAVMIFGISFIYGASNSVDFSAIALENVLTSLGLALFLIGVLFKLTAFPLHFWAPDVYSVANLPSLSVVAVLPKIAALLALANLIHYIDGKILSVIAFCAVASMVIGAFGAVFQTNVQKILAYSGIANIGYVLSLYSLDIFSVSIVLEYVVIYSISVIFMLIVLVNINKNFGYDGTIFGLRGIYKTNPLLAVLLTLALLNLAGIPPLSGFFAKYIVVRQFFQTGHITIMPFVILASSVVTLFYYLKIIKNMYFDSPSRELELYKSVAVSFGSKVCVAVIAAFVFSYAYLGYDVTYQGLVQNFYKQGENIKVIA